MLSVPFFKFWNSLFCLLIGYRHWKFFWIDLFYYFYLSYLKCFSRLCCCSRFLNPVFSHEFVTILVIILFNGANKYVNNCCSNRNTGTTALQHSSLSLGEVLQDSHMGNISASLTMMPGMSQIHPYGFAAVRQDTSQPTLLGC